MNSEYPIPGNLEGSSAQASFAWEETGICFAGGSFRALYGTWIQSCEGLFEKIL